MHNGRVGFIGLGDMGSVLAQRLMQGGIAVSVWARAPERAAATLSAGAEWAASPAELARICHIVLLCVTDTAAVEAVIFGENGLGEAANHGGIVVDHSTIHPLRTREFAERLRATNGMRWVDAPVTGGVGGARAGSLVIMAGGDVIDIAEVTPLLQHYSQRITHMGECGAGQATKIANQMIIGGNVAIVAEALNYAANFGVSAPLLPDALAGGWADSAVLQNHARRMAASNYEGDVNARIMVKDLDIASDLGRATESPMPVTALVQQMYRKIIADGDADKGQIGLMWLYAQRPL